MRQASRRLLDQWGAVGGEGGGRMATLYFLVRRPYFYIGTNFPGPGRNNNLLYYSSGFIFPPGGPRVSPLHLSVGPPYFYIGECFLGPAKIYCFLLGGINRRGNVLVGVVQLTFV